MQRYFMNDSELQELEQLIVDSHFKRGKGNPNGADFSERVAVLYSLAYSIKIMHKAFCTDLEQCKQVDYSDYTVFPLEGVWTYSLRYQIKEG